MADRLFQTEVRIAKIRLDAFDHAFSLRNKAIIDAVDLDTPPWQRETMGMWLDVPKPILELMRDSGMNAAEAIHAAQHACLNRFALATDLRTECKVPEKEYKASASQRNRPARVVIGVVLSQLVFT